MSSYLSLPHEMKPVPGTGNNDNALTQSVWPDNVWTHFPFCHFIIVLSADPKIR